MRELRTGLPADDNHLIFLQLEKMDNEKTSWCACGHTLDNTYTLACLPSLTYKFRVTAVNRLGDSEPLVSENISLSDGVDSSVRSETKLAISKINLVIHPIGF